MMAAEEYDRLKKETEGNSKITGIGIDLGKRCHGFVVVSPIDGSPAYRAGIEPGDVIERIDGVDATSIDWNDAGTRIPGPVGSEVVLTISRHGREMTFRIRREKKGLILDMRPSRPRPRPRTVATPRSCASAT